MTGETRPVDAHSLQKGSYVIIDGAACRVTNIQTSKPGKHGHAKIRITGVGLLDDKRRETVAPGSGSMDAPIIEKKNAQVLSIVGEVANVMDAITFETFDLPIPAELKGQVVEGCSILYWVILDSKVMKQVKGAD